MTFNELTECLERLAWQEQMDYEATERGAATEEPLIEQSLRQLAANTTPNLLDLLEQDGGYSTWLMRLSTYINEDNTPLRARRLLNNPSSEVRYLAEQLLKKN